MDIFRIQREITTVGPHIFGEIFGIPVTNTFLLSIAITILLAIVGYIVVKKFTLKPGTFQSATELLYESIVNLVDQITNNKKLSGRIFPIIAALFVYIGIANIIALIPGISSITWGGEAIFRTPTSDFNTTFGLALAFIILIQVDSIRSHGVFGYIGRFIKVKEVVRGFKKSLKDGALSLVDFFIGIMDIIAEVAKVISLSFRLFGNMFAGEVLAILILSAFSFILPALWLSLNLLFGIVQAIVFGALVAAYYTLAMKFEEAEKHDEFDKIAEDIETRKHAKFETIS